MYVYLFGIVLLGSCLAEYAPVKYGGPIVYSGERPPIIHFPPPPTDTQSYRSGKKSGSGAIPAIKPVLIYTSDNQPPIHVVHTPRPQVAKTNYKRSAPESQSSSDRVHRSLIQGQPLVFPSSFNTAGTDVRPIEPLYASSYDGLAIPYGPRALHVGADGKPLDQVQKRKRKRAAVNLPDGRVQTVAYTANHYG